MLGTAPGVLDQAQRQVLRVLAAQAVTHLLERGGGGPLVPSQRAPEQTPVTR